MKPRKNKTRKIFYQKPIPLHTAGKPEVIAEGFSSISTVGGNKIMRKGDVGVLVHDDIYVSPDGRSMTEITEQKQVGPGRISYSIQENSVYRSLPFLPVKKEKKTRRKNHNHHRKKNRS